MMRAFLAALLLCLVVPAHARDYGQWDGSDPAVRDWYRNLMQPDNPTSSCCGKADAYWSDSFFVRDGKTIAVITDTRPDAPLNRPHIDVGTEIEVPNYKLKYDAGNPSGHGVIFIHYGAVLCYVTPGGV